MRRFATLALSFSLVIGLAVAGRTFAQDEKKADAPKTETKVEETKPADAPKADAPKADAPKADAPKADAPKADAPKAAEAPSAIPPEVEAKLEAARRAVAEAIVAAQDAGLVDTSIEPPPILDILITGRATDAKALKGITKDSPEAGVSPEVFGAWFTGYGKPTEGITPEKNVRILQPSKGLKDWYSSRASILNKYIDEARKAKGDAPKAEEPKNADAPKAEESKTETKPADAPKADEAKPADAPKADEAKPADAPKAEETKTEAPKAEEPKADTPKG